MGLPKPWTKDGVLQAYFFTNPYRENDKTTVWFRKNIREPLRDEPAVLLATIIFRWFNLISTGKLLLKHDLILKWNQAKAVKIFNVARDNKEQVFTGAYMINSPHKERKIEAICRRVQQVWERREYLLSSWGEDTTMESGYKLLKTFEGLGGFMSYEIVTDLRHTYLLENATDKDTWCYLGPGAVRGLLRVYDLEFEKGKNCLFPHHPKEWKSMMIDLLRMVRRRLPKMPTFEMREIEHSLCEFDKYERARLGDGRMKRTFDGGEKL